MAAGAVAAEPVRGLPAHVQTAARRPINRASMRREFRVSNPYEYDLFSAGRLTGRVTWHAERRRAAGWYLRPWSGPAERAVIRRIAALGGTVVAVFGDHAEPKAA